MIIHRRGRVAAGRGRGKGRYANAKEIDDRGSWIRGSIDRRDIIAGIPTGRKGHDDDPPQPSAACGRMKYDKSPGNAERGREGGHGRKSENFPSPTPPPLPPSNGGRGEGGSGLAHSVGGRGRGPPSLHSVATGINSPDFTSDRKLRPRPLLVLSREAINLLAQFASLTTTDIAATDSKRRQRRPPPSEASSAVDDRRQRWRRKSQALIPEGDTFEDLHWSKNKDISCTNYHGHSSSLNFTRSPTRDIACKKK